MPETLDQQRARLPVALVKVYDVRLLNRGGRHSFRNKAHLFHAPHGLDMYIARISYDEAVFVVVASRWVKGSFAHHLAEAARAISDDDFTAATKDMVQSAFSDLSGVVGDPDRSVMTPFGPDQFWLPERIPCLQTQLT